MFIYFWATSVRLLDSQLLSGTVAQSTWTLLGAAPRFPLGRCCTLEWQSLPLQQPERRCLLLPSRGTSLARARQGWCGARGKLVPTGLIAHPDPCPQRCFVIHPGTAEQRLRHRRQLLKRLTEQFGVRKKVLHHCFAYANASLPLATRSNLRLMAAMQSKIVSEIPARFFAMSSIHHVPELLEDSV